MHSMARLMGRQLGRLWSLQLPLASQTNEPRAAEGTSIVVMDMTRATGAVNHESRLFPELE